MRAYAGPFFVGVSAAKAALMSPFSCLLQQDERVRLSEQLAAVMAELRQATEASRQRQELNSQVGGDVDTPRVSTPRVGCVCVCDLAAAAIQLQLQLQRIGSTEQPARELFIATS